jgi:hypothetical protein
VGEQETEPLPFASNGFLRVAFQDSRVTPDTGLILVRELDERLEPGAIVAEGRTSHQFRTAVEE